MSEKKNKTFKEKRKINRKIERKTTARAAFPFCQLAVKKFCITCKMSARLNLFACECREMREAREMEEMGEIGVSQAAAAAAEG